MPESVAVLPTGIEIAYDTVGDPSGEPLLLVMGLGGPLTWWHPTLCRLLTERGFFVIRFDNRDVGRSSRVPGGAPVRKSAVVRAYLGDRRYAPYTLDDMADDAFGLLDHLDIEDAHVTGASMGGMIAQTMAIARPHRVRSLVSIMATTGARSAGWQDPRLLRVLLAPVASTREAYIARAVKVWRVLSSPVYPTPDQDVAARAGETWDRGYDAAGGARQTLAVLAQTDRSPGLRTLPMPVAVVHGLADKLVHSSGGRATARAVPGSELVLVPGMAHDLPGPLHVLVADVIRRTADRVRSQASTPGPASVSATSVSSSSAR